MSEERKPARAHKVVIEQRERFSVTGVTDVVSFDEECVVCDTEMGVLVFKGSGMKVNNLNVGSGELSVDGAVDSISYETGRAGGKGKQSMFGRIFK